MLRVEPETALRVVLVFTVRVVPALLRVVFKLLLARTEFVVEPAVRVVVAVERVLVVVAA